MEVLGFFPSDGGLQPLGASNIFWQLDDLQLCFLGSQISRKVSYCSELLMVKCGRRVSG